MVDYCPMTILPAAAGYKAGDVLVLVGELFGRGYANGLLEEAKRLGMTVLGTTVGRRNSDGTLRPLTAEELAEAEALLGSRIINIPWRPVLTWKVRTAPHPLPNGSRRPSRMSGRASALSRAFLSRPVPRHGFLCQPAAGHDGMER